MPGELDPLPTPVVVAAKPHCTLQMTPTATPAARSSDTADTDANSSVLAAPEPPSEDSTDEEDEDEEGGDDSDGDDEDDEEDEPPSA